MAKLRFRISISLDGYVAGPNQSTRDPLGMGGERLHEWVTPLKAWRSSHGMPGGEVNESTRVIDEQMANIGATIMGRNMFGGHPGPWIPLSVDGEGHEVRWNGWWGENPPFHHPVFVLTHHARPTLLLQGGSSFTFVTDGIESALRQAQKAAGGKDISLSGGARAAQQFLKAGLVDEMELSQVPILLGDGERLFENVGDNLHGLQLVRTVATPQVTHLKFARP